MRLPMVLLVVASCAVASSASAQSAGKTLRTNGRVLAITAESLTIRPGMETKTFVIDSATKVKGKGVGTKTRALTAANKPVVITELVEEMDSVIVRYQDVSGKLHAREVEIKVKRRQ